MVEKEGVGGAVGRKGGGGGGMKREKLATTDRDHLTAERRTIKSVHTQCGRVSPGAGGSIWTVVIARC